MRECQILMLMLLFDFYLTIGLENKDEKTNNLQQAVLMLIMSFTRFKSFMENSSEKHQNPTEENTENQRFPDVQNCKNTKFTKYFLSRFECKYLSILEKDKTNL